MRGSLPAAGRDFVRYGGHTSCLALTADGASAPALVLDAGTGLLQAMELLGGTPFDGTILLTHLHWDHVVGLPFFAVHECESTRADVLLPEQENGASAARALGGLMSPPYFPVGPSELRGRWTFETLAAGEHEIEGFTVLAREIPHKGGRTYGYRVGDGHSSIAYMPDHNPTAFGPGPDGLGEYHAAALELAADVDVLVHDAQLLPQELAAEGALRTRRGRLRSSACEARELARGRAFPPPPRPHRRRTGCARGATCRALAGGQRRGRGRRARAVKRAACSAQARRARLRPGRRPAGPSGRCLRRLGARARGTPRSPRRSHRRVRRRAAGRPSSRPPRPAP